eukprot:scaffold207730_cov20-Tisochrysis_lutea.AAC.1
MASTSSTDIMPALSWPCPSGKGCWEGAEHVRYNSGPDKSEHQSSMQGVEDIHPIISRDTSDRAFRRGAVGVKVAQAEHWASSKGRWPVAHSSVKDRM